MSVLDLGPDAPYAGVCRFPARRLRAFAWVGVGCGCTDLNETAGIRLPDLSVPIGIHTGWNPRHPEQGAPAQAAAFAGMTRFFAAGELTRRYRDRAGFAQRVREAAHGLVEAGHVLGEDEDLLVRNCLTRYDLAMGRAAENA